MDKQKYCEVCAYRGVVLVNNDKHGLRIERCDTCNFFKSDEEALCWVMEVITKESY